MRSRISGIWMAIAVAAQAACYESNTVECPDGRVCPGGTVCTADGCATVEQVIACRGKADGELCAIASTEAGVCRNEVCHPSVCGDGFVDAGEQCDGDNLGTVSDCKDLGYYDSGPVSCAARCEYDATECTGRCGDGVTNGPEQCDGTATTTCQDRGFTNGGTVSCGSSCTWDVSGCS